ncbi:MAG: hypothetical protein PSW75_01305 [bacterium]|nr:hypothetical protein [bacterium]
MPVLLDTGALERLRRRDLRVENLALKHYPPVLCPHVAGEYIHWQLQAKVSKAAILRTRTYVAAFETLSPTTHTADYYAELRAALLDRGVVMPEPYCWIAAHALEHGIPLVTTDGTFRQLPGIKVHLIRLKQRAAAPVGSDAGGKAIGQMRAPKMVTGSKARWNPPNGSASALTLFTLYLAQDCLAESSVLLQSLSEAASGCY